MDGRQRRNVPAGASRTAWVIQAVARRWPRIADLDPPGQRRALGDIVGVAFSVPLMLGAIGWLIVTSDLALLQEYWPGAIVLVAASALLSAVPFVWFLERRSGTADWIQANLQPVVIISALLLVGPLALWVDVAQELASGASDWWRRPRTADHWNIARNRLFNLAATPLSLLTGTAAYAAAGGTLPLPALTAATAARATLLILVAFGVQILLMALYQLLLAGLGLLAVGAAGIGRYLRFIAVATLPAYAYGVLAAAVAHQIGFGAYLFLLSGVFLASLLARRWSLEAERGNQRARALAQLERLGRALLLAPPHATPLPALLAEAVPAMIRYDQMEIQLADGTILLRDLGGSATAPPTFWAWVCAEPRAQTFASGQVLPWDARPALAGLSTVSILPVAGGPPLGGILVRQLYRFDAPTALLPTLQTLADQIAASLERSVAYARDLALQQVQQELAFAAQIQASFLPQALPRITGWQFAAALRPARQTSGDFYDMLDLPGARVGLLVADVADKGTGAALFMALTRTLLRTYARAYPDAPAVVLAATNQRMLEDAQSSMFVTAFYAVLDLATGVLHYANAGQNPPLLYAPGAAQPQRLVTTGIPLGIEGASQWSEQTVHLAPAAALVLYSDGVTEAQNQQGDFYEEAGLIASVAAAPNRMAQALLDSILCQLADFVGGATQADDITLLVLAREQGGASDSQQ